MNQPPALLPDERLIRPPLEESAAHDKTLTDFPLARSFSVKDEIAFVDGMLSKYVAKNDKGHIPFQEVKDRVVERQKETRLFLGVIGEFSSGKSTLVNALIRENLLKTDIRQGTTAAATLLFYGKSLDVQIRRKKKGLAHRAASALTGSFKAIKGLFSASPPPPTRDDLLQLIFQATAEEEFAKDIVQVDVRTPSDALRKGLVVVDTPGANAANPRHGQVTIAALRDICDAALVVVPAEAAGSESLFNFLKANARDIMHRCVFVVTKIDLIRREKERDRVLNVLKARINQELGIANPRVVACAPQFIVETLETRSKEESSGFTPEEIRDWGNRFTAMERDLDQILRQKRMQAQVDDVVRLTMQLLTHLQTLLQQRLDGYRQRHEALAKLIIPDIEKFIDDRIDTHVKRCHDGLVKIASKAEREFPSIADSIVSSMASAIGSADSRKALQSVVESTIPGIYSSGQRDLQRLLQRILRDMSKAATTELRRFHDEFQEHFRALATLGGALSADRVDTRAIARDFSTRGEAANLAIAQELKGLDQQQTMAQIGGGVGGAVIGTMILPGIGTVIGGIIGGMFSMFFGPSLDELKTQCWNRLHPEVAAGLTGFAQSADEAINDTIRSTVKELAQAIASYLPRYQGLVQKMRDRDADEKRQLEEFQRQIQQDLNQIDGRRQKLDSLRVQLRDI